MPMGISVQQKFEELLNQLLNHALLYSTLKLSFSLGKLITSVIYS